MEDVVRDPRAEYARRLRDRREAASRQARLDAALSGTRLAVAVAAVLIAWLCWGAGVLTAWWLAAPAALFLVLVVAHERVAGARGRCERAASYYEMGLARLDHRWDGRGEAGQRFLDEAHPYAADLDLFGRGSMFERICTARTRAGEETLAGWLRAAAAPDEVRSRQEAVSELRHRLDLREDLALLGADVRAGVDPAALCRWAGVPPSLRSGIVRTGAFLLSLLAAATAIGWAVGAWGPAPLLAVLALEGAFALVVHSQVRHVIAVVDRAGHDLALLSQVLERIERERFAGARLTRLRAGLEASGAPPSARVARLRRLIDLLDARRNQLFAPLAYALMWATQIACALEAWREGSGRHVPGWIAAVGEVEALCALAGYAYENPDDPFPEILELGEGARLDAVGIGHPLIPPDRCVRNDMSLGREAPRVLVVSGSNMSGKSTLLRTVGINVALALAGAPVRARRLSLTPVPMGATLRIHDSLQAGTSRFYAEITRLREIAELAGATPPPLFLLDELLNGTNSHDRRIGAGAVVGSLVARGAIGLITTHDLALAQITEELGPRAANVHFEDHLEDGRMTFDYVMRPGVLSKSNALALMRAVGLDV